MLLTKEGGPEVRPGGSILNVYINNRTSKYMIELVEEERGRQIHSRVESSQLCFIFLCNTGKLEDKLSLACVKNWKINSSLCSREGNYFFSIPLF